MMPSLFYFPYTNKLVEENAGLFVLFAVPG